MSPLSPTNQRPWLLLKPTQCSTRVVPINLLAFAAVYNDGTFSLCHLESDCELIVVIRKL